MARIKKEKKEKVKKIRELQCQQCKIKTPIDKMVLYVHIASTGTTKDKYFHPGKCMEQHLQEQAFKDREAKELDELYEVIKRLHRLDVLPSTFFSGYLQPLRNGVFKMGTKVKKYKEGIPFPLMKETYLYIENTIDWARTNRKFDGALAELKYIFAAMVDKLPIVKKRMRQSEFAKGVAAEKSQSSQSQDDIAFMEREIIFKKKDNGKGRDLSDILD